MDLQQTTSTWRLKGIILNKDNPTRESSRYKEGLTKEKKVPYRRIGFSCKTAKDNVIYVEVCGQIQQEVTIEREGDVPKGKKRETKRIPWEKRDKTPKGWRLRTPSYDLVKQIHENYHDGDSVVLYGHISYNEYEDKVTPKYGISGISMATEPVDLDSEKFKEQNYFMQELVVVNAVKRYDTVFLTGRMISGAGVFTDYTFEVDQTVSNGLFAENVLSFSFGDVLKAWGVIHNRGIIDPKWNAITGSKKCLEINRIDPESYKPGLYKPEDFNLSDIETEEFAPVEATGTDTSLPFAADDDI